MRVSIWCPMWLMPSVVPLISHCKDARRRRSDGENINEVSCAGAAAGCDHPAIAAVFSSVADGVDGGTIEDEDKAIARSRGLCLLADDVDHGCDLVVLDK